MKPSPPGGEGLGGDAGAEGQAVGGAQAWRHRIHPLALRAVPLHPVEGDLM